MTISDAIPRAGLAVIPEYESDPPHCKAIFSSDTGMGVLLTLLIILSSCDTFFVLDPSNNYAIVL